MHIVELDTETAEQFEVGLSTRGLELSPQLGNEGRLVEASRLQGKCCWLIGGQQAENKVLSADEAMPEPALVPLGFNDDMTSRARETFEHDSAPPAAAVASFEGLVFAVHGLLGHSQGGSDLAP